MNEWDGLILRRIEIDADRVLTLLNGADLLVQKLSKHNDTPVGFAEMLVSTISNRALGFPRHVILASKVIQMKLTIIVLCGNEFHRRIFRLFRIRATFGRSEAKLKNLRVGIIDGRAEMHRVAGAHRNEENVREDQRVWRLERHVIASENSLFLNSCPIGFNHQLKLTLVHLLIMKRHIIFAAPKFERMRMEIVRMRRIDRVLHGLKPIAAQDFADIDLFYAIAADEQI